MTMYVKVESGRHELVYAFGHYEPKALSTHLQFQMDPLPTDSNHSSMAAYSVLEMSAEHMVFLWGRKHPIAARSLRVGDQLQLEGAGGGKISKISMVQRRGLYAPLTPSGKLLVNGIQVSSYVALQDGASECHIEIQGAKVLPFLSHQDFAHLGMGPLRILCSFPGHGLCSGREDDSSYYDEAGIHYLVAPFLKMALWADKQFFPVQVILLMLFLVTAGSLCFVESLVLNLVFILQAVIPLGLLLVTLMRLQRVGRSKDLESIPRNKP